MFSGPTGRESPRSSMAIMAVTSSPATVSGGRARALRGRRSRISGLLSSSAPRARPRRERADPVLEPDATRTPRRGRRLAAQLRAVRPVRIRDRGPVRDDPRLDARARRALRPQERMLPAARSFEAGGMTPCRICGAPAPFTRSFCEDVIECNARARARLGMSPSVCGLWKLRDYQRMFPRRRAA